MDFRSASEDLDNGRVNQDEITQQILALPCMYGIFKDKKKIFCLEVNNKQTSEEITVALIYSNLKLAVEASREFDIPSSWHLAQWSNIDEALKACVELKIDAVAFDSVPDGNSLSGLVIDKESLNELIWLSSTV